MYQRIQRLSEISAEPFVFLARRSARIHSDITHDVAPAWDGGFFCLHGHIGRFQNLSVALRLEIGMDRAAVTAALTEMVAASELRNAYVAMVASRDLPLIPGTRDPRDCGNHFYAWCVPYVRLMRPDLPDAERSAWIAKSVRRIPETSIDPLVKNYHWGDFTAGMLEGISRRTVLEMAAELGFDVDVRPLPPAEFIQADEVFMSTSGGGVLAITHVDDRIFANDTTGPITGALQARYWEWMYGPSLRTEITYL